jgi:hypothetical protein
MEHIVKYEDVEKRLCKLRLVEEVLPIILAYRHGDGSDGSTWWKLLQDCRNGDILQVDFEQRDPTVAARSFGT